MLGVSRHGSALSPCDVLVKHPAALVLKLSLNISSAVPSSSLLSSDGYRPPTLNRTWPNGSANVFYCSFINLANSSFGPSEFYSYVDDHNWAHGPDTNGPLALQHHQFQRPLHDYQSHERLIHQQAPHLQASQAPAVASHSPLLPAARPIYFLRLPNNDIQQRNALILQLPSNQPTAPPMCETQLFLKARDHHEGEKRLRLKLKSISQDMYKDGASQ